MTRLVDRPHRVYWLFDAAGDPLYVGITTQPHFRTGGHRSKPWGHLIAEVRFSEPMSREDAYRLEINEIQRLEPLHNVRRTHISVFIPMPVPA